ncbi:hypothetical protein M569_06854, partial [Genlisea aurea]
LDSHAVVQVNPPSQYPSFLKQLLKSHLSGKFYLGLPKKFCDEHLPSHDGTVILVDEDGQEYSTRYSFRKNRISGGWRGFSNAHKLMEGDSLVFHLLEPCRFKVYIVRACKASENSVSMVELPIPDSKKNPLPDPVETEHRVGRVHPTKRKRLIPDDKPGNAITLFNPNVIQSIRNSVPDAKFKDVNDFEAFSIRLDGLILDSQIPIDVRTRYYYLCCSQKICNLAIVMIAETVVIADAIRSSSLSISLHQLECWEKTLKAFDDLGMVVGFMRSRLHRLIGLSHEYQSNAETRRAKLAQTESPWSSMKLLAQNLEAEVKSLVSKNDMISLEFQQVAGAPW